MRLLLDTHALIWFYTGDEKLPLGIRERINYVSVACYVSIASLWEIGIKASTGKLELRIELAQLVAFMTTNKIELLPIAVSHIERLQTLPFHHRDPFDRLLIAQSLAENLLPMSRDGVFADYGVALLW